MFKFLKYLLFLFGLSLCFTSTTSCTSKKKTKTYYPNKRKAPSGKTDNCDCPKHDRKGRPVSNAKRR